jgi:biotin synthase
MSRKLIERCEEKAMNQVPLEREEAEGLLRIDSSEIFDLLAASNRVRRKFKGDEISLCAIINAKSGKCSENCGFCAQSAHFQTHAEIYPYLGTEKILEGARMALTQGAEKFCIVTSGYGYDSGPELDEICETIKEVRTSMPIKPCASLGILTDSAVADLKRAGLTEYHHNLETARSYFSKICTTHTYDEDAETVRKAKQGGLRVCCGGVFGMGESLAQRVELAFELRGLNVDAMPLNFLNPITGTPVTKFMVPLKPLEILKTIAMFRFVHPDKDVKVAGGREVNLRDLQSMVFAAGANSIMVGNYLTTKGRDYRQDLQMIQDLDLSVVFH